MRTVADRLISAWLRIESRGGKPPRSSQRLLPASAEAGPIHSPIEGHHGAISGGFRPPSSLHLEVRSRRAGADPSRWVGAEHCHPMATCSAGKGNKQRTYSLPRYAGRLQRGARESEDTRSPLCLGCTTACCQNLRNTATRGYRCLRDVIWTSQSELGLAEFLMAWETSPLSR